MTEVTSPGYMHVIGLMRSKPSICVECDNCGSPAAISGPVVVPESSTKEASTVVRPPSGQTPHRHRTLSGFARVQLYDM